MLNFARIFMFAAIAASQAIVIFLFVQISKPAKTVEAIKEEFE